MKIIGIVMYNTITNELQCICTGAAERILDWVGSKNFLGEEFYFLCKFFDPQGGIPSNIG